MPAIAPSVRTLGTSGEGGYAGSGLVTEVQDPHLERRGPRGLIVAPGIRGASGFQGSRGTPGTAGSSCRKAAFDPLGDALTELAGAPSTVLGALWASPLGELSSRGRWLPARRGSASTLEVSGRRSDYSHLSGMLRKDHRGRTAGPTCKACRHAQTRSG